MYDNEFETKEKKIWTKDKLNHNIHMYFETIIYSADTSSSGHGHQI